MNPELNVGDRVMLLNMEDESIHPGTWGTVTSVQVVFGVKQYGVNWDDGNKENPGKLISKLNLLSDVDIWTNDYLKKRKRPD